jgi:hypothetical protein
VNGATLPWILGLFGVLVLFTLVKIIGAWRQSKRSPYFFLRQQAEKRLQGYFWALVALLVLGGGSVRYSWQEPPDNAMRMAVLAQAKPVEAADEIPVLAFDEEESQSFTLNTLSGAVSSTTPISSALTLPPDRTLPEGLTLSSALPTEFDTVEPTAELLPDTTITPLVFSTEMDDDYKAVAPRQVFGEGFFTIYATFDYDHMVEGMAWSWIWRRNGEVVNGGNELWAYGDDGPGWIYYEPPEGFQPGEYTLEVWVNGELFQRGGLTIESEVANQ